MVKLRTLRLIVIGISIGNCAIALVSSNWNALAGWAVATLGWYTVVTRGKVND